MRIVVLPRGGDAHRRGDPSLGGEVEVRGGFVQQEDRRVDQVRAGERDQLALARRAGTGRARSRASGSRRATPR